ncbi:MAG: hypothetical protein IT521_06915 [Burkholderiales bacterium]|nr:hypothetical protein [Burkholderiales bacterium]
MTKRTSVLGSVVGALFALATVMSAVTCGPVQAKEASITVAQSIDVSSLNPYGDINTATFAMWKHIMEPLVLFDFNKRTYYGVLAESWTMKDTEYVFKIRKGIRFHDGNELTAHDVKFSLDQALNSIQAVILKSAIKSVDVVDDHTVRVNTKTPFANLLSRLKHIVIVSQKAHEKWGADIKDHPIGTGPFKFVTWKKGNYFVVAKAGSYWGEPAKLDKIIWRPIQEDASRVTALESGEVDVITAVPTHEVARLEKKPNLRVEKTRALRQLFIALSPRFEPFKNPQVRKAMNHAIDVDYIIKNVLDGMAYRAVGPTGPQHIGYNANIKPYSYDPKKARELLAQAGYPNGFDLKFNSSSGRYVKDREVAQVIADQLGRVGIRTQIVFGEHGTYWSDITKGKVNMYLSGGFNEEDPELFLSLYYETGITPRIGLSDPKFDELLRKERMTMNPAESDKLLQEISAYAYNEMVPTISLWHPVDLYGVNNRLVWKPNPNEEMYFHRAYVK